MRTRGGRGQFVVSSALIGLAFLTFGVACAEQADETPPAAATEMVTPSSAPAAVSAEGDEGDGDDEELELMDEPPVEMAPIPVDDMDQAALETACFEGRIDACDRLGH